MNISVEKAKFYYIQSPSELAIDHCLQNLNELTIDAINMKKFQKCLENIKSLKLNLHYKSLDYYSTDEILSTCKIENLILLDICCHEGMLETLFDHKELVSLCFENTPYMCCINRGYFKSYWLKLIGDSLPQLKRLVIAHVTEFSIKDIIYFIEKSVNLIELTLKFCKNMNDESFIRITEIYSNRKERFIFTFKFPNCEISEPLLTKYKHCVHLFYRN